MLERRVEELGLVGHVELPGFVDDPWSVIYSCDLFVLSSHWEGFGNVLIEAMVCGTPVVSTDCNYGPREIITHEQDGILVPVGNISALSNAMLSVLKNKDFGRRLAENAREKVKQFDTKVITKKYEQLFEEVLSKKNAG